MCIQEPDVRYNANTGKNYDEKLIYIGGEYTVKQIETHPSYNGVLYVLEEFTDDDWFDVQLFSVLSDIDEVELLNQRRASL